jgi:hypothetical protein
MKVVELIERLKTMPQDAEVITEGCDCFGDSRDVTYDQSDHTVVINRS